MRILLSTLLIAVPLSAHSIEAKFEGYADARLVLTPDEESWLDGGLGKFRYGSTNSELTFKWAEIVGEGSVRLTPGLTAVAVARIEPKQNKSIDLLEAYVRYRPVSTTPWRVNFKAGEFFPPISLENTEIGWTSPWTLTPSAINTWVGEELRIVGASAGVEYRRANGTLSLEGAMYGWNDPAGVLLAFRGWAMDDRPTAMHDHPQLPTALGMEFGAPTPWYTRIFKEIDNRPGWYLNGAWDERALGRLQIMRYDNHAEPDARKGQFAWHTQFWSAGYSNSWGPVTLLTQGMTGRTDVQPFTMFSMTEFDAAYALLGYQWDEWRFAARLDGFDTDESRIPAGDTYYTETGHAYTLGANWEPEHWLRLSAEALRIIAKRPFREEAGLAAKTDEIQLQLGVRLYY